MMKRDEREKNESREEKRRIEKRREDLLAGQP